MQFLSRRQIDDVAWDRCVSGAHNALVYGHSWYLDAVTDLPGWRWEGLVKETALPGTSVGIRYEAVLPIPLRWRWGRWVVYQPLFCQMLALFSTEAIDPTPFLRAVVARYRHASVWQVWLREPLPDLPVQVRQQVRYTHVLRLTGEPLSRYSADRRMNLRRATRRLGLVPNWQLTESTDCEPLLLLFWNNHAKSIGVGAWAYALLRRLIGVLQVRGLGTLQYTWVGDRAVAGVFFVRLHGRIIYLFNAADADGRRLNARSVLIDRLIREEQKKSAASTVTNGPILDFESPDKAGVVSFYESFGAEPQPYLVLSWSRLNGLERLARWLKNRFTA